MAKVAGAMRWIVVVISLAASALQAQDTAAFARALQHKGLRALDHWMKHELHRQRRGTLVTSPGTTYTMHSPTYDSLVTWLHQQPGVIGAAWGKCAKKIAIWPGRSTVGLRVRLNGVEHERCYTLQEGRIGTINLFGWRPQVRKAREVLKFAGAKECPGFVVEQRRLCTDH